MIRDGLYSIEGKALDGVEGGDSGVLVLRDGTIRGGTSFFYFIGTYSCSDGRWKGEMTIEEHTRAPASRPMARRIVSIGFSGTYTDTGAQISCTALIGKRSVRYDATLRLLIAD
jgi:T3SS negative regulator,GrlR